jgi:hypothetical protein
MEESSQGPLPENTKCTRMSSFSTCRSISIERMLAKVISDKNDVLSGNELVLSAVGFIKKKDLKQKCFKQNAFIFCLNPFNNKFEYPSRFYQA